MKKFTKKLIAGILCVTTMVMSIVPMTVTAATGVKTNITVSTAIAGSSKSISDLTKNDSFKVRDSRYSLTDQNVNRMTSEHFQIIWGKSNTANTKVTEDFVKGNLINLENIRTFYVERLGMKDISTSVTGAVSGKYKTNLYISNTGLSVFEDDWAYMSADEQGFAFLFLNPDAMRVDEPSWVIPHELAHAFTYHQGGTIDYAWYEATANWFRDQYLGSEYYAYGGKTYGPDSDFFAPYMINGEYYVPHMLNWYDTWPIFLYISENPDNINGLGLDLMHKIFENTQSDESMYATIERLSGVSIKTILGGMTKRLATMDFARQPYYLEELNNTLSYDSANYNKIYTTLKNADSSGYQAVKDSDAPMQTGFNIVPLNVDLSKDKLIADFVSTSKASGADFRTSIVTKTADNTTRYSNMLSGDGKAEITLRGDEVQAYLVVCATPDTIKGYQVDWDSKETDTDTRFTYKVKISAVNAEVTTETTTVTTTTKKTTTETSTETTTKQPVAPSGTAEMGTYLFGKTASGGDFNITSKAATEAGNVKFGFRDIADNGVKTRKNDGNTNIALTLGSDTYVTLASDKGMVAVDSNGQEYNFDGGETTIVLPAGTYTIMGITTSNTLLSKMVLASNGTTPPPTSETTTETTTVTTTTEKPTESTTTAMPGDVDLDNDVDDIDATLLLKYLLGNIDFTDSQSFINADCDGISGIDVRDAVWILKHKGDIPNVPRQMIAAGTYTASDILQNKNFIVSGSTAENAIKIDENGYVDFGIKDNAIVTIKFKCGSSDTTKSASISLYDRTSKTLYGKESAEDFVVSGLGEGYYRIFAQQSGGTTAQIISITVSY